MQVKSSSKKELKLDLKKKVTENKKIKGIRKGIKMIRNIIEEIEIFGECFIGTVEVQGTKVFKRFRKVESEWNKEHNEALAYNAETGLVWVIR